MAKFSDSNYDILEEYFDAVLGDGVGLGDSWLIGPKKGIIGEGGVSEILWEDNPQRGFIAHRFTIQDIEGNSFNMLYDGLVSTHSLASSAFEVGNDFYFRKDSFFYEYLAETNPEFRDYINQERTFCYFGKIWPVSDRTGVWNIEFYGMKDYMELTIPTHNRTPRLVEMMDVWFDQINHEPYNMTKYLWALLDAKEVDLRWLEYIARIYGVDINIELDELTLREWTDLLVYFLKRVGTYNAIYIVYKVFTALSENKLNVYERWEEWCQDGAGDIPSFKEFPNFFPGTKDFHWFEFYNIPASGGSGDAWYDQFTPSGAPTPNPYVGIEIDPYPVHASAGPSAGCSLVSASPSGYPVISPHYIVEIDLTSEPIGHRFDEDWILNEFYADELIRNWEYARPVNKYVQYQQLIAPACAQSRTGDPESLYPLSYLGYFNTSFTGSQYLSGAPPTPSGGEVAYVYTQSGESANWTITHNLSSSHIMVQAWTPVSGPSFFPMVRVIPNEIEIIDENTVYLNFDEAISGIANIAGYIPTISHEYDQVAPTNPWSVIHNLGTTSPSGYPSASVVNYFTSPNKSYPDEVELINVNRTNATWDDTETGVAFTRTADYVHTQTTASSAWSINHGMNTDGTIIHCYDSSNQLIHPMSTTMTDSNTCDVIFETAESGVAYLIYFIRDVIARLNDSCDITGMGMCPGGLGYWQVGNGGVEDYDAYLGGGLQSPTASGDYWRVWSDGGYEDAENYYIDFIVPVGEDLDIREVGLFNVNDDLIYYSVCSELFKPAEVQTVFHYRSQALWLTESSSSSSSSSSVSSSSSSTSSSSDSSSSTQFGILHETYLFPDIDTYMYKEGETNKVAGYYSSSPVSQIAGTSTSNGAGDIVNTYTPNIYNAIRVPDAPYHANATGVYRVRLKTRVQGTASGGLTGADVAHGTVWLLCNSALIAYNTYYEWRGVQLPYKLYWERDTGPTTWNQDITDTRYYIGENQAGVRMQLKVDAYADFGSTYNTFTSGEILELANETQYHNGEYGWPTAHDATSADFKSIGDTSYSEAMATQTYLPDDDPYRVTRSFLYFDFAWANDALRILDDTSLVMTAYNPSGAGYDDTSNVIIHSSEIIPVEGDIPLTYFDSFDTQMSEHFNWTEFDGTGWPYHHEIESNNLFTYIYNAMTVDPITNRHVSFGIREYSSDYLNIAPENGQFWHNGMYFSNYYLPPVPDNTPFSPILKVSYYKSPDWEYPEKPDWTTVTGTLSGSEWLSDNTGPSASIVLEPNGSWGGLQESPAWCDFIVSFTGPSEIYVQLEDGEEELYYTPVEYDTSWERVNIPWRGYFKGGGEGGGRLYGFTRITMTSDSPFAVQHVDFLKR